MKGNVTQVLQLPGQGQRSVGRTVTYSSGATPAGKDVDVFNFDYNFSS